MAEDPRRGIPRTDAVLADPRLVAAIANLGQSAVKGLVNAAQARARRGLADPLLIVEEVLAALPEKATTLRRVINATGVVVHTNLGRAPLSEAAIAALVEAGGYVDVELDLATGRRGKRGLATASALRDAVPGAGDALVVNNAAAALVLATTAYAAGREVIWSRGELVEIGDRFRLPDLIASTGVRIREVGTTNRSSIDDYAAALGPDTGCILKVHRSNFRVEGFTAEAGVAELAGLGVPVIADLGSGLLRPDPLLPDEPDFATTLAAGATVAIASADKLLGGPQAGLILGQTEAIAMVRRHPLARAMRVDKLTLAALEATLRGPRVPVDQYVHADPGQLRERTERLAAAVGAEVVESSGRVGGGGAPGLELPGFAVALSESVAARLRTHRPAVLARIERGRCLVDLRCVPDADDDLVGQAITDALRAG